MGEETAAQACEAMQWFGLITLEVGTPADMERGLHKCRLSAGRSRTGTGFSNV